MLLRVRNLKIILRRSVQIIFIYFFNQTGSREGAAIGHNFRPIYNRSSQRRKLLSFSESPKIGL